MLVQTQGFPNFSSSTSQLDHFLSSSHAKTGDRGAYLGKPRPSLHIPYPSLVFQIDISALTQRQLAFCFHSTCRDGSMQTPVDSHPCPKEVRCDACCKSFHFWPIYYNTLCWYLLLLSIIVVSAIFARHMLQPLVSSRGLVYYPTVSSPKKESLRVVFSFLFLSLSHIPYAQRNAQ